MSISESVSSKPTSSPAPEISSRARPGRPHTAWYNARKLTFTFKKKYVFFTILIKWKTASLSLISRQRWSQYVTGVKSTSSNEIAHKHGGQSCKEIKWSYWKIADVYSCRKGFSFSTSWATIGTGKIFRLYLKWNDIHAIYVHLIWSQKFFLSGIINMI